MTDGGRAPVARYVRTRRELLRDASLASLGLIVAACQITPSGTKKGGEIHLAWPWDLPPKGHWNVFGTGQILGGSFIEELYIPTLAIYRWADAKWDYLLAESHQTTNDGVTVKLRQGVKWDDGKPFTAQDVWTTFTIGRMKSFGIWRYIDRVDVKDDSTVFFHFKTPTSLADRLVLRGASIRPSSLYGDIAKQVDALFAAGKSTTSDEMKALSKQLGDMRPDKPPSLGPYKVDTSSVTEAQLTMVKNPGGLFSDKVNFDKVVVFQGETEQVTPLVLAGNIDFATHGFPVATDKAMQSVGLRILRAPLYTGPALYFHWENAAPFQDKRLRQAVAHAINRAESGQIAYGESSRAPKYDVGFSDSLVSNWVSSDAMAKLQSYDYDTSKADALMKDAGYAKGADGVYAKDGKKLEYELYFPSDFADWSSAAKHAADALTKFGIKINLRGQPRSTQGPDFNAGKFQISMNPWGIGNPHPQASLVRPLREFNTDQANLGGGQKYPLKQGSIDFDALLDAAGAGFDQAKQKQAVTTLATAFNDLLPAVMLWERLANFPVNEKDRVTGWPPNGDGIYQNGSGDLAVEILLLNGTLAPK